MNQSDLIEQLVQFTEGAINSKEAKKYLDWSRNNFEIALNYYYQAEERKQKSTHQNSKVFNELMEGAKKQQQLGKLIKQLKDEYNKPIEEQLKANVILEEKSVNQSLNYFETSDALQSVAVQVATKKTESQPTPGPKKPKQQKPQEQPMTQTPPQIRRQDGRFPYFLGATQVKGHVVGSHNFNDIGQQLLKLELESKAIGSGKRTSYQNILRICWVNKEIGRLNQEYENILCPLMANNLITIVAYHQASSQLSKTMDPIYLKLEIYLNADAVSDITHDSIDEDQQRLLKYRDQFIGLYELVDVNLIQNTVVEFSKGRKVEPAKVEQIEENKITKKNVVQSDDPWAKKPKQLTISQFQQQPQTIQDIKITTKQEVDSTQTDIDYDKILNLEQCQHEDLEHYEPVGMNTQLYDYQKQALTWLLSREGKLNSETPNEQGYRSLHPLWRQYQTSQNTLVYFNPFSGQTTLEFPTSSQRCKGGILADEMGLGKTVMFIALINSNPFDANTVKDYIQSKAANKIQVKKSIADFMSYKHKKWAKTLIILPLTLLSQWEQEIKLHSKNTKTIWLYYGADRSTVDLADYDIVLSTYGTVSHEYSRKDRDINSIFNYNWYRIILDEAHYIKGRTIQVAQAVYALDGYYRWCSTGTPVQNKLDEMFSLLHFIKLEPWSDYIWWNTYINKPYEEGKQDVFQLLSFIMQPILLRRTKKSKDKLGQPIIILPEKVIHLWNIVLSVEERNIYDKVEQRSQEEVQGYLSKGVLMSKYMKMFELLLRLRQICDHPFLMTTRSDVKNIEQLESALDQFIMLRSTTVIDQQELLMGEQDMPIKTYSKEETTKYKTELIRQIKDNEAMMCPVCLDKIDDAMVTCCLHVLCRLCAHGILTNNSQCPYCRRYLTKDDLMTLPRESSFSLDWRKEYKRSSKLEKIMDIINNKPDNEKIVIFTQFIGMIELIEFDLDKQGLKYLRLDGKLSQQQRSDVLTKFKDDCEYQIFIVSLKAGGVGLNLTMANHIILIDPWWNPAVEEQAIERVYRIGQDKVVNVHRLIVEQSVEKRIVEMHKIKQQLFDETVSFQERSQQRTSMLKDILLGS